jgi:hypothetical protein
MSAVFPSSDGRAAAPLAVTFSERAVASPLIRCLVTLMPPQKQPKKIAFAASNKAGAVAIGLA